MLSIRGLQKTTLIDYPEKIACTIFFFGCNFHCPFCHNKDLVLKSKKPPQFSEKEIFDFLKSRKEILEGVVLTGGEPTLYPHLKEFIKKIKKLGFLVKLDTNGANPKILKELVKKGLIDYMAMDFKAPIEKYEKVAGVKVNRKAILESLKFLISGKTDYEFRTTVVPTIHLEEDLIKMAKELEQLTINNKSRQGRGSSIKASGQLTKINWFLQQFRPGSCLDFKFNKLKTYPKNFYDKILPRLQQIIPNTLLRGI